MILNENGLKDKAQWESKGYSLPKYDRQEMIKNTKENPVWVHFGAGNIFRAFQANVAQNLLNEGVLTSGITVVEGFDYEIIEKKYRPNDNYSILVTLKADGNIEKTVVGSIGESCILDSENEAEFGRLKEIFAKDSLQLATFTITEKGYSLVDGKGELLGLVKADFEAGPVKPASYIGKVAALLYYRYANGRKPIAMVSTDNCSHNGDKLYAAMKGFAEKWAENGLCDKGFVDYVNDKACVSFPWSMIDKITPRPSTGIADSLEADGIEAMQPVITARNTYIAPFVNAEGPQYLVIEDKFPNGRPALEKAGVYLTDRKTVNEVERMKVTTCLNPLHTALAVYGCVLGYTSIAAEMKDVELVKLVEGIGPKEGMKVVVNPGILSPDDFVKEVIEQRLPNVFIPDTPQRIACDTSQKVGIRYGETIKSYVGKYGSASELNYIPVAIAGWLRYLMGVDDEGKAFELSPDPMLAQMQAAVAGIELGKPDSVGDRLKPVLSNANIFGSDLYEAGIGEKIEQIFTEEIAGPGAVRATLRKYV